MSESESFSLTFGMRVAKGTQVAIAKDGLVISTDGNSPTVVFQTRLSVAWQWFEIAMANLRICKVSNDEFIQDVLENAPGKEDDPLWRSCSAGMQAVIAVAFALDGLYAEIKQQFPLPKELTDKWKEARTARYAQISETIRRTFKISGDDAKLLRKMLRSIFELRDKAVHPPADFSFPVPYGNSEILVDRTLAAFQFDQVKETVGFAMTTMRMIENTSSKNESIRTFASSNIKMMDNALKNWAEMIME
ncbi:MAG TPA: hypothetical protein PKD26_04550 [Pyrinomonadaceae bacterium]|nr:hypothetical protein [Pyrinomonadaceae bacterium]